LAERRRRCRNSTPRSPAWSTSICTFAWQPEDAYRRNAKLFAYRGANIANGDGLLLDGWEPFAGKWPERSNPMSIQTRELYHSANGDRWCLAHDPAVACVFVRHEPNLASGGKISDIDIGTFLSRGGQGPEKQELLRLIGTLVEERESSRA
jgi:hypothetical protein